ncbi:hypothetical protein MRX96_020074 [Rhipicephalus microplus]
MYLTKRNINTDPQGRNLTSCVSAQTIHVDECTHEIEQNYTYYNSSSSTWINFLKNFTASSMQENGTVLNFFNSTYLVEGCRASLVGVRTDLSVCASLRPYKQLRRAYQPEQVVNGEGKGEEEHAGV